MFRKQFNGNRGCCNLLRTIFEVLRICRRGFRYRRDVHHGLREVSRKVTSLLCRWWKMNCTQREGTLYKITRSCIKRNMTRNQPILTPKARKESPEKSYLSPFNLIVSPNYYIFTLMYFNLKTKNVWTEFLFTRTKCL
jgi:hypothetical protein